MLTQDVGWGGGKSQKVIDHLNIEAGGNFPFPAAKNKPRGDAEEPTQITHRERSISAPNVANINADIRLPDQYYLRNHQGANRRKLLPCTCC